MREGLCTLTIAAAERALGRLTALGQGIPQPVDRQALLGCIPVVARSGFFQSRARKGPVLV